MEEVRTYAVTIGLVISLVRDDGKWWEGEELKEVLAENAIDFIKSAIHESPVELARLIDQIEEIDRKTPDQAARRELEARARADWEQFKDTRVFAHELDLFIGGELTSQLFDPPIRVRINADIDEADLIRWCDDWLDPLWGIEVLDPQRLPANGGSTWIYGRRSYCLDGRVDPNTDWLTDEDYADSQQPPA